MSGLFMIAISAAAVLIGALMAFKSRQRNRAHAQRMHEKRFPQIEFEYNRFNTSTDRSTEFILSEGRLKLTTDIHNLMISQGSLVAVNSSKYQDADVGFDVVIFPTGRELIESDTYSRWDQQGFITFLPTFPYTPYLWKGIQNELGVESDFPDVESIELELDQYEVDPAETRLVFHGQSKSDTPFSIAVDYSNFRIEVSIGVQTLEDSLMDSKS